MTRRDALLALAAIAACPFAARAQQPKILRIGFLGSSSAADWASRVEALQAGLRQQGYLEGKNIVIEFRWAEGSYHRLAALAAELVRLKVDVLVTHGTPGTLAAKQATTTIPIVMVHSGDAVATGLIAELSRPGGNVTGSTLLNPELMAKRLELAKEIIPGITEVAVLLNPDNPAKTPVLAAMQGVAQSLKLRLHPFEVRLADEFENAFRTMVQKAAGAVVVLEDTVFVAAAGAIGKLAQNARLPAIGFPELAPAGGLVGYGANYHAMYHRAATFVDKILRGVEPAEIPVQQPTKFDFVINLKTAHALAIQVPRSLLVRADSVIE
jgi:putative tryptophan/tyrosine transport system substrate-binding protein